MDKTKEAGRRGSGNRHKKRLLFPETTTYSTDSSSRTVIFINGSIYDLSTERRAHEAG